MTQNNASIIIHFSWRVTICNIFSVSTLFCLWWRNTCSSFFYLFVIHLLSYIPFYRGTGLSSGVYGFFSHLLYDVAYTFSFSVSTVYFEWKLFLGFIEQKMNGLCRQIYTSFQNYVEYKWVYNAKHHYTICALYYTSPCRLRHLDSILLHTLVLFQLKVSQKHMLAEKFFNACSYKTKIIVFCIHLFRASKTFLI